VTQPDRRSRLEEREAELVRALRGGTPPAGLDRRMIALASAGITHKRMRQVARAFPALTSDLGPDYRERFAAFAETNPPMDGGAIADGLAFGRAVASKRPLGKAATIERMIIRSSVTFRHGELRPRRTPYVAFTCLTRPVTLILVVRVPRVGTRVFST